MREKDVCLSNNGGKIDTYSNSNHMCGRSCGENKKKDGAGKDCVPLTAEKTNGRGVHWTRWFLGKEGQEYEDKHIVTLVLNTKAATSH